MKPLVCDMPYPSTENIGQDIKSGQIISFAYATLKGEISATLQYLYHEIFMQSFNKSDGDTLFSIALAEMKHFHILGQTMKTLGVNPLYVQYPHSQMYYNTSTISRATTPQKMLMDDIQSEMNAIAEYDKMLFVLKNEDVAAIIQRINLDEQLHLKTLKQMLEKYACQQ